MSREHFCYGNKAKTPAGEPELFRSNKGATTILNPRGGNLFKFKRIKAKL